jgi:hypothetical protein
MVHMQKYRYKEYEHVGLGGKLTRPSLQGKTFRVTQTFTRRTELIQ